MRKKAVLPVLALVLSLYSLTYILFPVFSHKIWLSLKILVLSQKSYANSIIEKPANFSYEVQGQRAQNSKTFQTKDGLTWIGTLGPVHYKEIYDDSHSWLDVDLNAKTSTQEYDLYDKAPVNIKIFKNKTGYEVTSRRSGDKYTVELAQVDGKDQTKYSDNDNLVFNFEVHPAGVRLWKELKNQNAPKTFKWKITKQTKENPTLSFREEVEAFDKDLNKAQVTKQKQEIDANSFYWNETFSGKVKDENDQEKEAQYPVKIDVDVIEQVGASNDDAMRAYSADFFNTSDTSCVVGYNNRANKWMMCGMRFQTVAVPRGATITSASLVLNANNFYPNGELNTQLKAKFGQKILITPPHLAPKQTGMVVSLRP